MATRTETLELTLEDVCQLEFNLADRHRRISEEIGVAQEFINGHKHPNGMEVQMMKGVIISYKGQQEDIDLQLYYLRNLFRDHPRDLKHLFKPC